MEADGAEVDPSDDDTETPVFECSWRPKIMLKGLGCSGKAILCERVKSWTFGFWMPLGNR